MHQLVPKTSKNLAIANLTLMLHYLISADFPYKPSYLNFCEDRTNRGRVNWGSPVLVSTKSNMLNWKLMYFTYLPALLTTLMGNVSYYSYAFSSVFIPFKL